MFILKKKKQKTKNKSRHVLNEFIWKARKIIRTFLIWLALRVSFIFGACFLSCVTYFYLIIPPFETILDGRKEGSVTFLDKDGDKFAWRGEQFSKSSGSQGENKYLKHAIISSEDKNFYSHFGIDTIAIIRASISNTQTIFNNQKLIGASTITQQVVKNLLLSNEVSFDRKIKEILLSIRVENILSKNQILELYLNDIYLAFRSYGLDDKLRRLSSNSS